MVLGADGTSLGFSSETLRVSVLTLTFLGGAASLILDSVDGTSLESEAEFILGFRHDE